MMCCSLGLFPSAQSFNRLSAEEKASFGNSEEQSATLLTCRSLGEGAITW